MLSSGNRLHFGKASVHYCKVVSIKRPMEKRLLFEIASSKKNYCTTLSKDKEDRLPITETNEDTRWVKNFQDDLKRPPPAVEADTRQKG